MKFRWLLLCCVGLAGPCTAEAVDHDVVVTIDKGVLRGTLERDVMSFKGIPFASPPVRSRRWREAGEELPWSGVRDATKFSPRCSQTRSSPSDRYFDEGEWRVSEDCLYLNVWAPQGGRSLPVMVWIHSGGLVRGAGSSERNNGAELARRGVVVVTFNYRLGIFGFLAHPELSRESADSASGNYGIMDQISALSWVRRNVRAFGGDPERITIFGSSAGGWSTSYLMASPLAQGLFHRAIAQSNGDFGPMVGLREHPYDIPTAEEQGLAFATSLGAESISELREMSAQELLAASERNPFLTRANVDGRVLKGSVAEVFSQGGQADVPLIVGFNRDEPSLMPDLYEPVPESPARYAEEIRERYGDLASRFLTLYPADSPKESAARAFRDAVMSWAMQKWASLMNAKSSNAYLYRLDQSPARDGESIGAFHGADNLYVFDHMDTFSEYPNIEVEVDEADRELADLMSGYWAFFAREGKPPQTWQPYTPEQRYLMVFQDGEGRLTKQPTPDEFDLFEEINLRRQEEEEFWDYRNVGLKGSVDSRE